MLLAPGDTLGPYEISASIGEGGMGEVYRAHDPRLRRDVAIKVSAERFSERFTTEARAIAALNHSNVCTLHDIGPNYLVMELVEGQTLAARIKESPIPLEEALVIARQIAAALEAAHEKGITHRDLKPGNIILKPDGTLKVLDFGLAKIGGTPTAQSENSPTQTIGLTQAGVILGTASYMSPEQARGKEVDKRADIWAFGVVLHEMLTGRRLFDGEDLTETLASVVKDRPDLSGVPARVRPLLERCLEKDPKRRLRDIGDMELLLVETPTPPAASRFGRWTGIAAAVMTLAAAGLGIVAYLATRPAELKPLVRLDVELGTDVSLPDTDRGEMGVAISPDGNRLAYISGAPAKLFIRRLDQAKATELPGTENASTPFFSPDGQWVGFAARGKLNKIPVDGGSLVPLGDVQPYFYTLGASWGEDGSILFGGSPPNGMLRIPSGGGAPESVVPLAGSDLSPIRPQLLPGGKVVLFTLGAPVGQAAPDRQRIEVITLADRHRKIVVPGVAAARYLPTSTGMGHLIYNVRTTLFAVPFDLDKLETRGTPVPVLDDVAHHAFTGAAGLDFSRTGTLVYRRAGPGSGKALATMQWVDAAGKRDPLPAKPDDYSVASLSPDGQRVVLRLAGEGGADLWVYDARRDVMTRLTAGGKSRNAFPVWSPDGRYIVFNTRAGIAQIRSDGAGQQQPLISGKYLLFPRSFTPDGKRLAYHEEADSVKSQIWTVHLEEQDDRLNAGKPEPFRQNAFSDIEPTFSPDGRWLAYRSDESGKDEVYVQAFPPPASGLGGKWQISSNGGTGVRWSRNGHDLFYQSGDQILAVAYTVKGDVFLAEKPRVHIAKLGARAGHVTWDLAPDGKRVLVLTPLESEEGPRQDHQIVMLLNFFDELRRKVPLEK